MKERYTGNRLQRPLAYHQNAPNTANGRAASVSVSSSLSIIFAALFNTRIISMNAFENNFEH